MVSTHSSPATENPHHIVAEGNWIAPFAGTIPPGGSTTVRIPGSKSLTNRYLVLAAIANSPSVLHAPLHSRDSALMIQALTALGVKIEEIETESPFGPDLRVIPLKRSSTYTYHNVQIDCGLAGTVMRFVPPLALLLAGQFTFDGDPHARKRPLAPVIQALRDLGATINPQEQSLPFTLESSGNILAQEITIDASGSSQFLSALLLAGAAFESGLLIHHRGPSIPSLPHVEMTLAVMREVGIMVESRGDSSWFVPATSFPGFETTVEPDLSNAGPFLAAATALGATVTIPDWPKSTTQGGDHWRKILPLFGATVSHNQNGLTVTGSADRQKFLSSGIELDLSEAGELAPTVAALCALTRSPSKLSGIAHLRGHETDRLAALSMEINRLKGQAHETTDGLTISAPAHRGDLVHTYDDHRMATAAAIIGLLVEHTVIENIATTSKTLPDFPDMWKKMLTNFAESTSHE
ncbi:3-phosphoshikimate 1-carboxyvinyltransferase [uncultured Rothia sp.]|uniref:3-phosphoshikimate 1-carboxyvinyltransferase n=1 Tax=uncultured Rothia sp. TaxID=316088 RepID=UPI003217530F